MEQTESIRLNKRVLNNCVEINSKSERIFIRFCNSAKQVLDNEI